MKRRFNNVGISHSSSDTSGAIAEEDIVMDTFRKWDPGNVVQRACSVSRQIRPGETVRIQLPNELA
jgi:hypothetical protein